MIATAQPSLLQAPPLSLYVHLPWCVRKCPYCDFNSHQLKTDLPEREYFDALMRDLEASASLTQQGTIETIFFGGGTPSLFPPAFFGEFLSRLRNFFELADGAEVTMEANPGTVEYSPLPEYVSAGVNRLSIGVQSFSNNALKSLGRIHDASDAEQAVKRALNAGFDSVNLDLMYALPQQNLALALEDVDRAVGLGVPHISHYQLTIEPNTLFAAKPPSLPNNDLAWEMQIACQQRLSDAGYEQYEVSGYARDNRRCRHNLNYWLFGDYLGIGAGAHGKLTDPQAGLVRRHIKQKHPRLYISASGQSQCTVEMRQLNSADLQFEFVLNALRLNQGFGRAEYESRTGLPLDLSEPHWKECLENGWLQFEHERMMATELGQRFLNDVLERFLNDA